MAILWIALWVAQAYLLGIAGLFTARALLLSSSGLLVATLALSWRLEPRLSAWRRGSMSIGLPQVASWLNQPIALRVVVPLGMAAAVLMYSIAALLVLPVSNHDALSYHFTKAARLATTGSFGLYPSTDLRVTYFPANYELLAATFLAFLHADTGTGLITTGSLVLLLASSFTLFQRAWKDASAAATAVTVMLASPVLLLHATAHKNDVLMGAFALTALIWLGRYASRGGTGSAVVGLVSAALATGTKFHGMFLVLACMTLLWRAWRTGIWRPSFGMAALQGAGVLVLFVVFGGIQYVLNLAATGQIIGLQQFPTPNAMNSVAYPAYWQLPRFLWMFLSAPLFAGQQYFIVPWSGETWLWPGYELYFSHYGVHVSLLILLLPIGVWWARRRLDASVRSEVTAISVAALLLVILNLLIGLRPYGGFAFIPRFLFFALPVLLVWTWCPWAIVLERRQWWAWLPLTASLVLSSTYFLITITRDRFSPVDYVHVLWRDPSLRRSVFHSNWRAASILDFLAPSGATVAIDAGYDGWVYPAYGADLSRKVRLIPAGHGPYEPEPDVQWVVIDHAFTRIWGHPDFTDMSRATRFIDRGSLRDWEARVYSSLEHNPDFERVYSYPSRFQAVFRRVRPVPAPMERSVDQVRWIVGRSEPWEAFVRPE